MGRLAHDFQDVLRDHMRQGIHVSLEYLVKGWYMYVYVDCHGLLFLILLFFALVDIDVGIDRLFVPALWFTMDGPRTELGALVSVLVMTCSVLAHRHGHGPIVTNY
eukprot:scaffold58726_cov58-Attheya_sp.AAC.4